MKSYAAFLIMLFCFLVQSRAETVNDYLIAPLDVIQIDVYNEKDLSKEFRVSGTGSISFPLLGSVEVAGLTPQGLETKLRDLLGKDYLVTPHVMVTVKEYRKRMVTVLGDVVEPGQFDLPGEQKLDIVEAISKARGFTKLANKDKIVLTRQGAKKIISFNEALKKKVFLEAGDIIFVDQSFF